MSRSDWKLVQVVVYPPGADPAGRLERTVRLPRSAGFEDLLAALETCAPDVYAQVCCCIARATSSEPGAPWSASSLETLDRYFALGGPVVCPGVVEESV